MPKKKNKQFHQAPAKPEVIRIGEYDRPFLMGYYCSGGSNAAFGEFKGEVLDVSSRGLLIKRLFISYMETDGSFVDGAEDHIWIKKSSAFKKAGIKKGDCGSFTRIAYTYTREDGTKSCSLRDCEEVQKISDYHQRRNTPCFSYGDIRRTVYL